MTHHPAFPLGSGLTLRVVDGPEGSLELERDGVLLLLGSFSADEALSRTFVDFDANLTIAWGGCPAGPPLAVRVQRNRLISRWVPPAGVVSTPIGQLWGIAVKGRCRVTHVKTSGAVETYAPPARLGLQARLRTRQPGEGVHYSTAPTRGKN